MKVGPATTSGNCSKEYYIYEQKNKVLLGAIGLVLLSGIAATSSTFAWFTTVRTASISYSKATVQSSDGNLAIEYKSSLILGVVLQLMML